MHLILHLGPPKTGSTSIQRALWRGVDALTAADQAAKLAAMEP